MSKIYAIVDQGLEVQSNYVHIGKIGASRLLLLSGTNAQLSELSGSSVIKIKDNARQVNRINKFLENHGEYPLPEYFNLDEIIDALVQIFAPERLVSDFDIFDVEE